MKTKKLINVKNLSVSFGNNIILNNINFYLSKKESLVIIGKSGSGKSVFKVPYGFVKPDVESIEINGVNIVNTNRRAKKMLLKI